MSVEAVKWALYKSPTMYTTAGKPDTTARAILAVLAEHAGDSGDDAHPSVLRLRWSTGYDERTIQRALQRLETAKIITRRGVTREGVVRWWLSLHIVRSAEEQEAFEEEAHRARQADSDRRRAGRTKAKHVDVSGTQNPARRTQSPGHIETDVSIDDLAPDAESGAPDAESGVRDFKYGAPDLTPPEPPMNHPEPPNEPPTGAAAGPRPPATRRSSFVGSTDRIHPPPSIRHPDPPPDQHGDSRPRARGEESACPDPADPATPPAAPHPTADPTDASAAANASPTPTPHPGSTTTGHHPSAPSSPPPSAQDPPSSPAPAATPPPPQETATPAAGNRPEPWHEVWIAARRKDIQAHRPLDPEPGNALAYTACRRSMRTGAVIQASQASYRHQATWCPQCWPTTREDAA